MRALGHLIPGSLTSLTGEVEVPDVFEQQGAVEGVHLGAEAHGAGAQLAVHVVERMGHGVDGVDDKLYLPLLLVQRVVPYPLLICNSNTESD